MGPEITSMFKPSSTGNQALLLYYYYYYYW